MRWSPPARFRAGTVIGACILFGAVVAGCSPDPQHATAAPHVSNTTIPGSSIEPAVLQRNLGSLSQVSGAITGTMTVGSDVRPLSGTLTINGNSTMIELVVGAPSSATSPATSSTTYAEIVVKGRRYTSRDGKVWVDRGVKAPSTTLRSLFVGADTVVDSGPSTVAGITAHKFLTAPDKVDVAPALGLDTWTFDQETSTLRVWADDTGQPVGFGASLSWKLLLGGVYVDVNTEMDVMFGANPPAAIAAPTGLWQWKQDDPTGIAFGYPGGQAQIPTTINYSCSSVGKQSLSQATKKVVDGMSDTPSGATTIVIDNEDAAWMTVRRAAQQDYAVMAIVVHETQACTIVVAGRPADQAAIEAQAKQVLATVEFTR